MLLPDVFRYFESLEPPVVVSLDDQAADVLVSVPDHVARHPDDRAAAGGQRAIVDRIKKLTGNELSYFYFCRVFVFYLSNRVSRSNCSWPTPALTLHWALSLEI